METQILSPSQSIQSQKIRAKFLASDISLATARAEKFLVERWPSIKSDNSHEGYALLIATLADYDLTQLDEMFNEAGGQG
jgi:hypothetical protein